MNTRLLVRQNTDIPFLDTVYDGGFLALQVTDLANLNIQSGDNISIEQQDPTLNPQYDAVHTVFYTTPANNTITLATVWGQSGPVNPGTITNVTRGNGAGGTYSVTFTPSDLDLREDLQFPLNFNIADIRTPQNRKSNFSKQIELPGTRENSLLLSQLFEIDVDSVFNVNRKHSCFVLQDGLEIFNGTMRINTIKRANWNTVSYEVSLDGELADLFSALKNSDGTELMLSDLDLSEYKHGITRDNIISSWTGTIVKNGAPFTTISETLVGPVSDTSFADGARTAFIVGATAASGLVVGDVVRFVSSDTGGTGSLQFPQSQGHHTVVGFLNSGDPVVNLAFQSGDVNPGNLYLTQAKGEGYVYPTVSYGVEGNIVNTEDWPNGTKVQWTPWIFIKTYLDKIFEKTGFTYSSSFFESQFFKRLLTNGNNPTVVEGLVVETSSNLIFDTDGDDSSIVPFDTELQDGNDQWNSSTFEFTNLPVYGFPAFVVNFTGSYSNFNAFFQLSKLRLVMYRSNNPDGSLNASWPTGTGVVCFNQVIIQGTSFVAPGYSTVLTSGGGSGTAGTFETTIACDFINLQPNEQVRFVFFSTLHDGASITINSLARLTVPNPISNTVTNVDMTAKDFLLSLINAFNLYVEPDRFNANKIIIEPFNDYYLDKFIDWTDKVDISQDIEIEPISPSLAKVYKFTYDEDSDYLNKDYKDVRAKVYGEKVKIVETEFSTQTIETKLKFAATPLGDPTAPGDPNDIQTGALIIPLIYKDDQRNSPQQIKPRMIYWTGLRRSSEEFGVAIGYSGASGGSTVAEYGMPMYGYAGHLDNPLDATLDLNFDLAQHYYYGKDYPFIVTANTLFERYWKDYLSELTAQSSRFVRYYIKLNSIDITTLSFQKIYFIKGNYLRLQKISDYNPLTGKPVLCEFVKAQFNPTIDNNIVPEGCYPSGTEISGYLGTEADLDAICFGNGYVAGTNALIASGTYEGYRRTLVSGASAGSAVFSNVAPAVNEWVGVGTDYEAVLAGNGYFTVDGIGNTSAYQNVYLVMEAAGSSSGVTPVLLNQTPFSAPGGTGTAFYSILPPASPVLDLDRQIQFYQSDSQNGDYTAVAGTIMSEQDLIDNPVELPFNVWYRIKYFTETCNYGYSRGYIPVG